MGRKCIKCGYERDDADTAPEYECPRCGVVYAKAIPTPRPSQSAKGLSSRSRKEWSIAILGAAFIFFVFGSGKDIVNCSGRIDLPPHVVADNRPILNGRRIQIETRNIDLTRDQCIALIYGYRGQASPQGQVSVHKPTKRRNGTMMPWCVDNFDGRGVIFNDHFFEIGQ